MIGHQEKSALCVFEYIYFAKEDSVIRKKTVAEERKKMGQILAQKLKKETMSPDIIIDVPSSSFYYASAVAEELNIPYEKGFCKNNYIGRSFIEGTQAERNLTVTLKMNAIGNLIKDKKIAVIDDSIVRGTTSKKLVSLLRNNGAKEIYFISASPQIKYPCVYGIDMTIRKDLIAANMSIKEIENYIKADRVIYQDLEDLQSFYKLRSGICDACFSGSYPTGITEEEINELEKERLNCSC